MSIYIGVLRKHKTKPIYTFREEPILKPTSNAHLFIENIFIILNYVY